MKREALADLPDIEWHLIGPLQSNKARAGGGDLRLRSKPSTALKVAERLAAARSPVIGVRSMVFVQVNAQRRGDQRAARAAGGRGPRARRSHGLPGLTLRGIMGISGTDGRPCGAARAVPFAARMLRRLPGRGSVRRHVVDGNVRRSRGGHCGRRDRSSRRHGDFRKRANGMIVTFIGGGNMATALIGGRVAAGGTPRDIRVVEPLACAARRRSRRDLRNRRFAATHAPQVDRRAQTPSCFAVKAAADARRRARALAPHVADVGVIVTIAAGIRTADFVPLARRIPPYRARDAQHAGAWWALGSAAPTRRLRSMPRRAKSRRRFLARPAMSYGARAKTRSMRVTAVSGSGPAYVFYVLEGTRAGGARPGIRRARRAVLAYATVAGAMKLAQQSDADPATLRAQVTSKGGTTERALATLEARGVKAATDRRGRCGAARAGKELGDEFGRDDA